MDVLSSLKENADLSYRDFHSALLPTVKKETLLGVRVPVIRKIAINAAKENTQIGSYYYEERMVLGMIIGYKKCPLQERFIMLDNFVPLIDNWAVCDCCCATYKFVKNNKREVWDYILKYLNKSCYEFRFAVVMMLDYFIDDEYIERVLSILSSIHSSEYYVNMAVAWALSVAYVKYRDKTMLIIKSNLLDDEIHNRTIRKICESNRVDKKEKEKLKKYRR